jgi:hypothetical protein
MDRDFVNPIVIIDCKSTPNSIYILRQDVLTRTAIILLTTLTKRLLKIEDESLQQLSFLLECGCKNLFTRIVPNSSCNRGRI